MNYQDTYQTYENHDEAFTIFARQVEEIIQRDVEVYATQIVQDKKEDKKSQDSDVKEEEKPVASDIKISLPENN